MLIQKLLGNLSEVWGIPWLSPKQPPLLKYVTDTPVMVTTQHIDCHIEVRCKYAFAGVSAL